MRLRKLRDSHGGQAAYSPGPIGVLTCSSCCRCRYPGCHVSPPRAALADDESISRRTTDSDGPDDGHNDIPWPLTLRRPESTRARATEIYLFMLPTARQSPAALHAPFLVSIHDYMAGQPCRSGFPQTPDLLGGTAPPPGLLSRLCPIAEPWYCLRAASHHDEPSP